MLSAEKYYSRIVRPTVEDFYAHNGDMRLAMLACMATVHVVDYVVQNRMPMTTRGEAKAVDDEVARIANDLADRHMTFAVVRAYGTASKHGRIGLQRKFKPGFDGSGARNRPPAFAGRLVCGVSFLGDTVGGITIPWTERGHVNLTKALRHLLPVLEQEFPELVAAAEPSERDPAQPSGPDVA